MNTTNVNRGSRARCRSDKEIVQWLLGHELDENNCTPYCPGWHCHTSPTGANALMVFFDDAGNFTGICCHHQHCELHRQLFTSAVKKRILQEQAAAKSNLRLPAGEPPRPWRALGTHTGTQGGISGSSLPKGSKLSVEEVQQRAQQLAAQCPVDVTLAMLRTVSPVPIPENPGEWAALMLENLFRDGEHVIIIDRSKSNGDYEYVVGEGFYQLSPRYNDDSREPVEQLPAACSEGRFFLSSPVTGRWETKKVGTGTGRRHEAACTRFPHLLIESDTVELDTWLKVIAQQRLPIVSICTSGGKSVHVLLRLDDAADWREASRQYGELIDLGADKKAMAKVQLTRLPGVIRQGKVSPSNDGLQRLLYLDPNAGRLDGQLTTLLERIQTLSITK